MRIRNYRPTLKAESLVTHDIPLSSEFCWWHFYYFITAADTVESFDLVHVYHLLSISLNNLFLLSRSRRSFFPGGNGSIFYGPGGSILFDHIQMRQRNQTTERCASNLLE